MSLDPEASQRRWLESRSTATRLVSRRIHLLSAALALTYLCGCAPAIDQSAPNSELTAPDVEGRNDIGSSARNGPPVFAAAGAHNSQQRLAMLWQTRRQAASNTDYPIGPGDILIINAAGIEELSNRTIRVTGDGFILLPLVGSIRAVGLTEEELKTTISKKLASYIKEPEVSIF